MAVKFLPKKVTSNEKPAPWVAAAAAIPGISILDEVSCSLLSTYTSKGEKSTTIKDGLPLPPHWRVDPEGFRKPCYCEKCMEILGERILNGVPSATDEFAGYTCNHCFNAARPHENIHEFGGYTNTHRCTQCSREIKSWQRASQLADELIEFRNDNLVRLRFITLTLPNYQDALVGLADLKKKIKNFRRSKAYQAKVIGGVDFYEWTTASDGTKNVHYHGIWAGKFWKQGDLLDSWSHGGARIELVKAKHEAADTIRYCTKYLTKMKEYGIRTKQKFGDFYNYSGQGTGTAG